MPFDGHFNPLTSLAVHLKNSGHDVRWYAQELYKEKIERYNIPYYSFQKALQFNQFSLDKVFENRSQIKNPLKKADFDMEHIFVNRAPELYEDIKVIENEFSFDILVCDIGFSAIPFVKNKMNKPVVSIGIVPLLESSKDLPPYGLGLPPATSLLGRKKQDFQRFMANNVLFKHNKRFKNLLKSHGLQAEGVNLFTSMVKSSTLVLQSGTPSFEYKRSDMGRNIRFVGPLLPYKSGNTAEKFELLPKYKKYQKIILVTQGTVEKDVQKILVPTLKAFKNSNYLVVATTGGSRTKELRDQFPDENFIIEDFIAFNDIMPYADVFVTNGGYGGVLLAIKHQLPLVVAGIAELKNEINARVAFFKLGIDLKSELPKEHQIKKAVNEVVTNNIYKSNIRALSKEFEQYNPEVLCEMHLETVLKEFYTS